MKEIDIAEQWWNTLPKEDKHVLIVELYKKHMKINELLKNKRR